MTGEPGCAFILLTHARISSATCFRLMRIEALAVLGLPPRDGMKSAGHVGLLGAPML
jgi:hypothetical protein